ncbi:MAG: LPXTG cell wall anchor domain-containing protein [Lachnospiraceae bacterium]|nr:LPXTG cell wall anchor domain-containing protein [Lachnospiraceae bacterium]
MKHWGKKLAALLLCAAMAIGLMPGMHLTALAYDGNPYAGLVGTTTTVKFNGMEWYLIEDKSTAVDAGYVTLLAKDPVGACAFSDNEDNHYSTSYIKSFLDGLTADGGFFAGVADAIMEIPVRTDNPHNFSWGPDQTAARLYLLSTEEAEKLPEAVRKCAKASVAIGNNWWLRSPGENPDEAAFVSGDDGWIGSLGTDVGAIRCVRPALRLDLTKVKFITVNVSGGANATCSASDIYFAGKNIFLLKNESASRVAAIYDADEGYTFPETSEYYTEINGITVSRINDTRVIFMGTPNGIVNITIPDAVKPQTITASDVAATYGDTDKKVSATTDGGGKISYAVKDGSGDYIDVDATTGALTVKKVPADGKAYVTVTAAATGSYGAAAKDVTVTISRAELTIKAKAQAYEYNGSPQGESGMAYEDPDDIASVVEVSGSGLKNNDKLTGVKLYGYETYAGYYNDKIVIDRFEIKNGNADAKDNYRITLVNGPLEILRAKVTVTGLTAADRAYEPGNLEVTLSGGTVSGVISGDDVTLDLTSVKGTMEDDAAGTNKPVNVLNVTLSGEKARNYHLNNSVTGVTVTITKASQATPAAPEAETVTGNSVTLKKTDGCQYSTDGTNWQDSNVFEGLDPDTEYTFYQRMAGDKNHEPSPSSEGTKTKTNSITYTAVKVEGDGQTAGRNTDLVVEIKRSENDDKTYDSYTGAEMDGKAIPEEDTSKAKGSLVLTVKSTYMETLSAGDHTLKVSFGDGSVEIPVTIRAAETSPKTGDATNLFLWAGLALLSLACLAALTAFQASRKKRQ